MKKQLLSDFKNGTKLEILELECGKDFCRRLCDLGLFPEAEVEIIKNDKSGPIIIKILESKIALGRGEAKKIYAKAI